MIEGAPLVAAVAQAAIKELKPVVDAEHTATKLDVHETINSHNHNQTITHKFKIEGEYGITKTDVESVQDKQESKKRGRKWWHCSCFGK
jgi:hypothetical protein